MKDSILLKNVIILPEPDRDQQIRQKNSGMETQTHCLWTAFCNHERQTHWVFGHETQPLDESHEVKQGIGYEQNPLAEL